MSKVLFVVANGEIGENGEGTGEITVPEGIRSKVDGVSDEGTVPGGPHIVELGVPYYGLRREVVIGSPNGGSVEPYVKSNDADHAACKARLDNDPELQKKLRNTISLNDPTSITAEELDGIFFVGGFGAMFGIPESVALQGLTATLCEEGKLVAWICHGGVGPANTTLSDGRPMVQGRVVTSLTNAEEKKSNKHLILEAMGVPLLETLLREQGAKFVSAKPWEPCVKIDKATINGIETVLASAQNPKAAPGLVRAMNTILRAT